MKKFLFFLAIFAIVIAFVLIAIFIHKESRYSNIVEISKEFKINKVIYYSSANAVNNTTSFQNPEWNLNVYQYTDIAIYLERINQDSYKNYITDIVLKNFKSEKENTKFYYLNPNDFGKSDLRDDDLVENSIEYTVINSENKEEQHYNIPIFFQDCSHPITIRVVTELAKNYRVPKDKTLIYNGNLIRELGLGIEDLNESINFDLNIKTRGFRDFKNVELQIPYEENENNILNGDIKVVEEAEILF